MEAHFHHGIKKVIFITILTFSEFQLFSLNSEFSYRNSVFSIMEYKR